MTDCIAARGASSSFGWLTKRSFAVFVAPDTGRAGMFHKAWRLVRQKMREGRDFELVDPENDPRFREYWETYRGLMAREGVTPEAAKASVRRSNTLISALMLPDGATLQRTEGAAAEAPAATTTKAADPEPTFVAASYTYTNSDQRVPQVTGNPTIQTLDIHPQFSLSHLGEMSDGQRG